MGDVLIMSSPEDLIFLPGTAGMFARRALVEAWQAAGSPPVNSATRLKNEQQYYYDGWVNRLPGFNPADNPNDSRQALAHVRGVALDTDPTPERVRRLSAAGLVRPYSYEPWHWQLPGDVRRFALITKAPVQGANSTPETPIERDEDMWRILSCPAYDAAQQVVLMRENACETVPRGWVINMILQGGVREIRYAGNNAMMDEVRNFYFTKSKDQEEAAAEMERVLGKTINTTTKEAR